MKGFRAKEIGAEECLLLRSLVLRPGQPVEASRYPGDAAAVHFGVFEAQEREPLSIVTAHADSLPPVLAGWPEKSWRIRGMATHPDYRGKGLGALALRALEERMRACGIPALWCNARVGALDFYHKQGYERFGERFAIPLIGDHYVMGKRL